MPCGRKEYYTEKQRRAYFATSKWARKPRKVKRKKKHKKRR